MSGYDVIKIRATGLKLSGLLWSHYRRRIVGSVEAVLTENPGLSVFVELPLGAEIKVPVASSFEAVEQITAVRIFD